MQCEHRHQERQTEKKTPLRQLYENGYLRNKFSDALRETWNKPRDAPRKGEESKHTQNLD